MVHKGPQDRKVLQGRKVAKVLLEVLVLLVALGRKARLALQVAAEVLGHKVRLALRVVAEGLDRKALRELKEPRGLLAVAELAHKERKVFKELEALKEQVGHKVLVEAAVDPLTIG